MARILLVEDDRWSRRIVVDLLCYAGHVPTEAHDMATARAALAEHGPFALVLLDIQFPGGSGVELLRELRADPATATIPVIALTAAAMAGDRERFLAQGFTAYMSKPIDVRSFASTIAGYLP